MTTLRINSNILLENANGTLVEHCLKANTFTNPLYVSNQQAGRSNWSTNNTIVTYRYDGESLLLPRGYLRDLEKACCEFGIIPEIVDERSIVPGVYPSQLFGVTLRSYQSRAVNDADQCEQGMIISPTGSGKSIIGLEIIRSRAQRALILVHRGELAKQWAEVVGELLGIKAGFIGNGRWVIGEEITIAMVQTISAVAKEESAKTLYDAFGLVILDEAHHAPCSTVADVLGRFKAKYRYGLSATPQRRDGLEPIIYRSIGPALSLISRKEVEGLGATVPVRVSVVDTSFAPTGADSWHEYVTALSSDSNRNEIIIDLAQQTGGAALIIVDRVSHAEQLSKMLDMRGLDHVLAHGKIAQKQRSNVMARIRSAQLTVGTYSLLGEGIDIAVWGTLIIGAPISTEIKLLQAIGRVIRPAPGKEKALVYDLRDDCAFARSSFKKRFAIYAKNKIRVDFSHRKKCGSSLSQEGCYRLERSETGKAALTSSDTINIGFNDYVTC